MNKLLFFLFIVAFSIFAQAQEEGSLDSSFGINGQIANSYFSDKKISASSVLKTIAGANGKTYLYGSYSTGHASGALGLSMVCINESGHVDSSFGINGRVYFQPNTHLNTSVLNIVSIQVDAFNRIVFGLVNHRILRFLPTGYLDSTFGINGEVLLAISGFTTTNLASLLVQADGKIVCAGNCVNPGKRAVLSRFNQNGSLDTSFNLTGIVLGLFNTGGYSNEVKRHFLLHDGKIVVVGNANNQYNSDFALSRYLPNGTIDIDYGINGISKINYDFGEDVILSVTSTKDTGVLVYGNISFLIGGTARIIAKFLANGRVDSSFGSAGRFTTSVYTDQIMSWKNDGVLLTSLSGYEYQFTSYLKNGSFDSSFGNAGRGSFPRKTFLSLFMSSRDILTNEHVVLAGFHNKPYDQQFGFVRINPNGRIDSSFGANGLGSIQMGMPYFNSAATGMVSKIAVRPDKKIVSVGSAIEFSTPKIFILWFKQDGTKDNSIGQNGQLLLGDGVAKSVLPLADNSILVSGYINQENSKKAILFKLKPNGSFDSSFGENGSVVINQSLANGRNEFNDIDLQSDGKIVVTGSGIARFSANGQLDSSFGQLGYITSIYGLNSVILKDNSIVVAGDTILSKYSADGKSKPWSYVEKAHYNCASWAGGPFTRPYSYYEPFVDNDDNIFVRGGKYFDPLYITAISCVENGGDVQFLFTKNGTPVTSFGTGGKIINSTKLLKTSTLSLGDKVLSFSMGNTSNSYVIYKNLRNGSPNGTFGNGGKTLFYQSLIKLAQPINPYHSCFLSDSSFLIGFLHNDSIFFSKHFIRKDEFVSFSLLNKNVGLVFDTFRLSPIASSGIKSFRWNIPGAIYINGTDSNSSHPEFVFTNSGYKSVSVFGVDENGNVLDSYQQTNFITVFHLDFLSSINFGAIGTPIQLNSLVFPFPASYKWEIEGNPVFYSGYNLHVQNPYFYFAKTGSFSIKLTIKTASGDSFTISKPDYIRMYSLTFTQDKSTSTLTNPIFNVSATSNPLANRYLWMAKPASGQAENSVSIVGSNLSNATITATDTGWYQVQVTGYFGVSDSVIILKNRAIYISVEPITNKPIADFFVNKRSGNTNEIFFFNDSSRYFPTEWEWTITPNNAWFEDSDNRSKNPFVAFFENGSYTIKLKVGNAFGADSIVKYDYIQIGPVGLAEPNRKKELLIYPNPVKEQLFVKYFGKEAPILKIIDMSGKVVYESLYAASDSNAMEINTTELPSGFYFISIQTNESIINKTFVLSR